ncbi:helix-turn-helix domain-containing protein [Agromyces sp. Root81]|uniref:helix-turn-helix domain-containing protein n=1 Tax=Agromyces sp. Root81 TaxID=1736601 RepID=UPI0012F8451F
MSEFPPAPERTLDEPTVDPHEVATYLGAHVGTVRRYASNGEIPAFKVGGRWRFFLSDVRAHLTTPKSEGQWNQSNQSRGRTRKR